MMSGTRFSITALETQMARASFERDRVAQEEGAERLLENREKREEARAKMTGLREQANGVEAALADELDESWLGEHFCEALLGIDDFGDIQREQMRTEADLQKEQAQIESLQADQREIFDLLREADNGVRSTLDAVEELLADQEKSVALAGE